MAAGSLSKGGDVSTQTVLNIILSVLTLYLGYRNYVLNNNRENQTETREMTEIRVQLDNVMGMLRDMQKDIRNSTTDFRELTGRVIIIETKLGEAFSRIVKLEQEGHGKQ